MHYLYKPCYTALTILRTLITFALSSFSLSSVATESTLNILHWETSLSEKKAVATLKQGFNDSGYDWIDQPIASGKAWQQASIFESVLLAEGGSDFYRETLIDQNPEALKSETIIKVFKKLRQITSLTDPEQSRSSRDQATQEVINKKAAVTLMGDWA